VRGELLRRRRLRQFRRALLSQRLRRPQLPVASKVVRPKAERPPGPVHKVRRVHAMPLRPTEGKGEHNKAYPISMHKCMYVLEPVTRRSKIEKKKGMVCTYNAYVGSKKTKTGLL
jgi:hypothetical protein